MTVHKHANLIHAFADGKVLQYKEKGLEEWMDWTNKFCPNTEHYDVRIKPDVRRLVVNVAVNIKKGRKMEDDDVGSTEYWRDIKQAKQEKRADNRESSAEYLAQRGIPFVSKNGGAHLVIEGDTIEELKLTAAQETEKRGWTDCWSEKCDD